MLHLLAQASAPASAPEPATPPAPPFNWVLWEPNTHDLLIALLFFTGTLLVGIILLFLLRKILQRSRLALPTVIATFALAFYLAAWGLKPARLLDTSDPLSFWITRLFIAVMLFVLLRFLDRLAIIPLLTRGNKLPLPRFFHQIVNIVLGLFTILIFGSIAFGWDIDKFLAGSAVVSIVLGLALQESLGNFFSGLVMNAAPPFAIGDWIVCGDHEGRVVDMTWRAVTIHTNDDNFIVIPNATVAKADITNFHAPTTATARTVKVGLESDIPPDTLLPLLKAAALETPGVEASPPPFIYLEEFADTAVNYAVKFWISDPSRHRKIEHAVRTHIWYRLREKGIGIPNPTYIVEHLSLDHKNRRLQGKAGTRFLDAIEHVPLLQPLSNEQKRSLASAANDILLTEGQVLFRQNDSGNSFYIIHKGTVDVLVTPPPPHNATDERKVATLNPGDFFGEMSALTGQPRTATIRAASPLELVQIEKKDLFPLFQADPSIMEKISTLVAKRNAEREAIMQGPGTTPAPDTITRQQKSLLGRMISFFRLGNPST